MREYKFYVKSPSGEVTYETTEKALVMERLAEQLKYHYIYKSPTIKRVDRATDYQTETITFRMEDGYKFIYMLPCF